MKTLPRACDLEDFAILLCEQARRHGCRAAATWDAGSLKVRIQDGCAESLQQVCQWLAESAAEQGAEVEIGADQEAGPRIRDFDDAPIPWGTVVHARLTRELLCALPEGAFVVCNASPGELAVALGPSRSVRHARTAMAASPRCGAR